jgi:hypothetical protein
MIFSEALLKLGYTDFVTYSDDVKDIVWIVEPEKKPTQKLVEDTIKQLNSEKLKEESVKIENKKSALEKLTKLGLTEEELASIL